MRTHMEVLAPQAPGLPESLRTLVVSPERELEPGATLRATFTFRNHGSAPATGVRVRFLLRDGLIYEGEDPAFLTSDGAPVGDVEPGAERRVELPFRLAETAESDSEITLQAAVAALGVPPVGSNIARWTVQRRPEIRAHLRRKGSETVSPGDEVECTLALVNDGRIPATGALVRIQAGSGLEDVRVFEKRKRLSPLGDAEVAVDAGTLKPEMERRLRIRARVRLPFNHRDELLLIASLQCRELTNAPLGEMSWRIASQASFSPALTHYQSHNGASVSADADQADADREVISLESDAENENPAPQLQPVPDVQRAREPEQPSRAIRFLNETRFPGLVRHLFALRALLPEDTNWGRTREQLDRLFIKLRLPHYTIAERDIETSPRFWLEKAEALADESIEWTVYRGGLVDELSKLQDAEPPAFLDALQNGEFRILHAALDAVYNRLSS